MQLDAAGNYTYVQNGQIVKNCIMQIDGAYMDSMRMESCMLERVSNIITETIAQRQVEAYTFPSGIRIGVEIGIIMTRPEMRYAIRK